MSFMEGSIITPPDDPASPIAKAVTLRRLEAFAQVYRDRVLAEAAYHLNLPKRNLDRMIRELEHAFGCALFDRKKDGVLSPTAFGERLHNDMRFITAASRRLEDRITAIRQSGRVLRIGSSPIVFRTTFFSQLFRELRSAADTRISYVPVFARDAARALTAGRCDWFVGYHGNIGHRFASREISEARLRLYRRRRENVKSKAGGNRYAVAFDGQEAPPAGRRGSWRPISEEQWLRWLDRPEECEPGSEVFAPEVPVDPGYWTQADTGTDGGMHRPVTCCYIRQHPYEFIPSLLHHVSTRFLSR